MSDNTNGECNMQNEPTIDGAGSSETIVKPQAESSQVDSHTQNEQERPDFLVDAFFYMGLHVPKDKVSNIVDAVVTKIDLPDGGVKYTIGDNPDVKINKFLYEKIYNEQFDLYNVDKGKIVDMIKGDYPEAFDKELSESDRLALKFLPTVTFGNGAYFLERVPVGKHKDDFIIPFIKVPANQIYNFPVFSLQDVHVFPRLYEYTTMFRKYDLLTSFKFITAFSNIVFNYTPEGECDPVDV